MKIAAESRIAELEGALEQAASDFREVRRQLLDNTSLWETRQFLVDSVRRCWAALGKWEDGPKETA